ncbi:MAG TPA: hypothetical protein DET40_24260 [Lentisphaeria bacterium]|nr:MAG: hypothetical protein A2X45_00020 [Lentisphaerae bacterium GWF2_50_93]HCE46674.1 hypothetical protein [Lentisphaeria bacterium]
MVKNKISVYKDKLQPLEKRIADLVSRMTLEKKARQLDMFMGSGIVDKMRTMTAISPDGKFAPEKAKELWGDVGVGSVHDLYPVSAENGR